MDAQKVDMFLMTNSSKTTCQSYTYHQGSSVGDGRIQADLFTNLRFKDPTIILIISVFLGSLGIDRFLIGDVALGVGKLVTLGGCGIWMIIDWFLIMDATKKKNLEQLQNILMF